ncbi:DUF4013 domain-containing protein [Salinadaptatus halalkaliphilus]|uniref:DUF4013 domain-containing protein n=1 Tax=Salinadaptatus halalkaliphilus TaxID=2419781 RepID=A0A4S3TQE8_9EURY|nr:DUF4013 domain-containing protein [Salinadaptatus halalkaliphilus]THE66619.1 DUF4013 domain-containing protein [Salinadaptatus halalkaliphilus]
MIEDSLSYPVRNDWIGRILIGGVLTALGVLLFPLFLVMGYYVRVLEATTNGDADPPEFTEWGGLFVDGLKATVIAFVYSFVPFLLWGVVVFGLVGAGGAIGGDGGGLLTGLGLVSMLLVLPLMLLIYYLVPAALASFASTGSVGAAFDVDTLKPVLLSSDYVIAILIPFVIGVVLNIVGFILGMTVVGIVLVPFVSFYAYMVIFRLFGLAFAKQTSRGRTRQTGAMAGL